MPRSDEERFGALEAMPSYWAGRAAVRRALIDELVMAQHMEMPAPRRPRRDEDDREMGPQLPTSVTSAVAAAVRLEIARNAAILREYEMFEAPVVLG